FTTQAILNSDVESENWGGSSDNTIGTAQALDGTAISIGVSGGDRMAVLGGVGAVTGRLFATPADGSGDIVELNPNTGAEVHRFLAPEPPSGGPDGLAFDGTNLWFINSFGTDTLWELNPDTGAVENSFTVTGGDGFYDGLGALNGKVYVQDYGNDTILVFDPTSGTTVNVLNIAQNP